MAGYPPGGVYYADEVLDVDEELARLDREGRSIDFDKPDRDAAWGASLCAIVFFVLTQALGFLVLHAHVPWWFIGVTVLVDIMYARMVLGNPGTLARGGCPRVESITEGFSDDLRKEQWCRWCRLVRPPRAKHCHKCGACVAKFDHHCFWLMNCVGAANHRDFLLFLIILNYWFVTGCLFAYALFDEEEYGELVYPKYHAVCYLLICGAGMECFALPLLWGHLYFMWNNITTVEFARPEKFFYLRGGVRSPFNITLEANLRRFLCVTDVLPPEDHQPVLARYGLRL